MPRVLSILTDGREAIRSDVELAEKAISTLSQIPEMNGSQALADQVEGRDRLLVHLRIIDRTIADVKAAGESIPATDEPPPTLRPVVPGQYRNMKLTTATQAFLSERGGGPLPIMAIVQGLIAGGCKIAQTRSKYHKAEPPRDPNPRDLRRQANSNRPRYFYDEHKDKIGLRMENAAEGITTWKVSKRDKAAELRRS
jgi:hypothetical protein